MPRFHVAPLLSLAVACHKDDPGPIPASAQDIREAALALDLEDLTGEARITAVPGDGQVLLDVSGLRVDEVLLDGEPVRARAEAGWLSVPAAGAEPVEVEVRYGFPTRTFATFDGWMPGLGVSFIWPSACGNLYPCNPDTADGLRFELALSGVSPELVAVAPARIPSDAPPYMLGFAVGDYARVELGESGGGVRLSAWYLDEPEGLEQAESGTAHLVDSWSFFERTYGPYAFGDEAGTVEVDWGPDSWGGMEHHPFFHVARWDFGNEEPQVHEAAHGWFGDGVRLQCWEDFVLSEGTTTYITARALEVVDGPNLWPMYVDDYLTPICEGTDVNALVWPEGCNAIEFETSPLWSLAPYMKGACFYEEVADTLGAEALDAVIAAFYQEHVNQAARMGDMVDAILAAADPADRPVIEGYVQDWLLQRACPADFAQRCRAHQR